MRAAAVLSALAALAPALHAQGAERAVFLVRFGSDTIAVERASRTATRLEGRLQMRLPPLRVAQTLLLGEAGAVTRLETEIADGARPDAPPRRVALTFAGDSATSHVATAEGAPAIADQRFAVPPGAVPFVNLSGLSLELLLRRARAIGGDTARVPVLLLGGQVLNALVVRAGADSAVVTLGGVTLRAHTDAAGRLLGAAVPAQRVVFERLPGDAAVAWTPAELVSYDAPPGAPYTASDATVRTPAGLVLAGTLTLPARRAGERLPAVVLISGSGPQDRDEHSAALPAAYRPFRELADTLSRRGIAVLRLDDRGVGGSSAGPPGATTPELADDIRAAVAWLRARPEIDPARVGLVGHSEGGLIAPMVAVDDPRLRAIALVAAPASRGRALMDYQIRSLFARDTTIPPAQRDSLLAAALHERDSVIAAPGWLHWFADYDPLPTARRLRLPVLLLQGETDQQVPVGEAAALAAAMRAGGNRRVTVRTFPRMNHLMLEDPTGDLRGYGRLPGYRVRRDLLGTLADWLSAALSAKSRATAPPPGEDSGFS